MKLCMLENDCNIVEIDGQKCFLYKSFNVGERSESKTYYRRSIHLHSMITGNFFG